MRKVIYPELVAEIAKSGEMQKDIAALLTIRESTVSRKIKGLSEWTMPEIATLCRHYGKSFEELFTKCRR